MFDFTGKKVVITGAAGGIGSALTKVFAEQGANIVASGSNKEKLEKFTNSFADQARIHPVVCNLASESDCTNLIDKALEILDGIDILICNGGTNKDNLIARMSLEDFDDVININLRSSFLLNKLALKPMIKQKYGRIINISSVVAFMGNPGQSNYVASKAGLVGMSKALAMEVASRNITVNCIAPGFITSPMTDALNDKQKEYMLERIPCKRFGDPEDVAYAALFLASKEASYITGQTIHVNGAMYNV